MTRDDDTRFAGTIPETYDRCLGPLLFEPYAADLVARLAMAPAIRVLEIACGTGIVTRRLLAALPADASLVATDLSEDMLAIARRNVGADARLTWRQADAGALPFPDGAFDAVVCQFGLMFVPDKLAALREMRRVLAPGGRSLVSVWGSDAENEMVRIVKEAVSEYLRGPAPDFYGVPYSMHDRSALAALHAEAGFDAVEVRPVALVGRGETARDVARGFVCGTPALPALIERGADPERVVAAVAAALGEACGDEPLRSRMLALVVSARQAAI